MLAGMKAAVIVDSVDELVDIHVQCSDNSSSSLCSLVGVFGMFTERDCAHSNDE
jgi:hypothetical protein